MKYILALDQGTTSSRAVLFNGQGKIQRQIILAHRHKVGIYAELSKLLGLLSVYSVPTGMCRRTNC